MSNINKNIKKQIKKNQKYVFQNKYLNNLSTNNKNFFAEPIGLFDPLGENVNPFTLQPYQNLYSNEIIEYKQGPLKGTTVPKTYKNLAYNWTLFTVYQYLTQILKSIQENQVTIIRAGTGVGKTVTVPKIALQAFNFQKKIVCTVPKKKLTISNSEFTAQCLDVKIGEEIGYYFMGKNMTSDKTKLVFTTPGSLKSKLTGGDPYLEEYNCVILDEIHERSVETDQLLLYMKAIMEKRPEFRLILMSATVDLNIFKNYFTKLSKFSYQELDIPGALEFKVNILYEPKSIPDWKAGAINKVEQILKTTSVGDILIFVKSGADGNMIREELSRKIKSLNKANQSENPLMLIFDSKADEDTRKLSTNAYLYKSSLDEQGNPYTRRIILATNVAESSITIDGIIYVIDNGFALESAYYPAENARSLLEERISEAAANQRKGRAGRTTDGTCYRLYTEEEFKKFRPFPVPDIQKTDLTSGILDMFLLDYIKNVGDVKDYLNKLISPPAEVFINSSLNKLVALEAITGTSNKDTVTQMGKGLAKFRIIEPNFAKAILASYYYHCKNEVLDIITIAELIDSRIDGLYNKYRPTKKMSNSDIKKEEAEFKKKQHKFDSQYGDYITMLNIYYALKNYMKNNPNASAKTWCIENGISSRVFVNKFKSKSKDGEDEENTKDAGRKWDLIYNKSQKLNNILMKIVRPAELKKKYYNEYKKNGGPENIQEINKNIIIEKNEVIDGDDDIFSDDFELVATDKLKSGGYIAKPFEVNFFPNAKSFNSIEKNIMMALAIGNITNLAKQIDKKKLIYKTCFPEKKVYTNLDKNTTLSAKNATKLIMYHELFMARKDAKFLKLNITTKIPVDVGATLKKEYGNYIKSCFENEKMEYNKSKNKDITNSKSKDKSKDKLKKKFQGKFKHKFKKSKY